jgi:hypothetical protein
MVDAASQCISWLLLQGTGETVQPRWDEAAAFADPGIYAVYG